MSLAMLEATKAHAQKEVEAFKQIQREVSKCISSRTQLAQQYSENDMVLEELKRLDEDAKVFKLIGPALIKQDLIEAKSNVTKRLEYIQAEIDRLESSLKSLETKSNEKQQDIQKLQQKLQALQPPQQQAA